MTSAADATLSIRRAGVSDAAALADLAAKTFPLSCPPHTAAADIQQHIDTVLSTAQFAVDLRTDGIVFYLLEAETDPLEVETDLVAYAMLVRGTQFPGAAASFPGTAASDNPLELRRIYVTAAFHGTGAASTLMDRCIFHGRTHGYDMIWLCTNEANRRALNFYARKRFQVVGERDFRVGTAIEHDHVLARSLDKWPGSA